jgi:hypothetical protein
MSTSTVTSEALQLKLRQLLPSQQGFGTDLSASDTIIPIIDLTAAAEGSDVSETLQTAIAFGSQTAFRAASSTVALANSPGFYRVIGTAAGSKASSNYKLSLDMTDGSTTKIVWSIEASSFTGANSVTAEIDLTFYLDVGITLNAVSGAGEGVIIGSVRQVADNNGTLVQPVGFTPQ